ncbi:hypothetical protein [Armatimonas rosea]|uniref:Uncharacterized protein n=1 Tax=Armatimonas rosea TaxID=685828 RepID=A0A7W9W6A4_ARMRO|nr:hypothetical protein [Armatimonas rosea]MBB6049936.1 hypothetical protein [Armatimonas rosea]
MKHIGSILGVAGLLVVMSASRPAKAQGNNELIDAIAGEINRVRARPDKVASELKGQKEALIAARVKVGDSKEDATKAIESCILDLENIPTKYDRLEKIYLDGTLTSTAQFFADSREPSKPASSRQIYAKMLKGGYRPPLPLPISKDSFEEILLTLPSKGTNSEKAKEIIQDLLIDGGASNISSGYLRRCFILDYRLVSIPPKQAAYRVVFAGIGVKGESLRIQYLVRPR